MRSPPSASSPASLMFGPSSSWKLSTSFGHQLGRCQTLAHLYRKGGHAARNVLVVGDTLRASGLGCLDVLKPCSLQVRGVVIGGGAIPATLRRTELGKRHGLCVGGG